MTNVTLDRWAVKATRPDFTTRGGFQWAFPGGWTDDPADGNYYYAETDSPQEWVAASGWSHSYTANVCPQGRGDGLSVAKTVRGMAQGGYSPVTVLVVGFNDSDVIAEDADKIKVRRAYTLEVWDGLDLIRRHGNGADLTGANLPGADLSRANLTGADLSRADLTGADLTRVRWNEETVWPAGFDKDRLT